MVAGAAFTAAEAFTGAAVASMVAASGEQRLAFTADPVADPVAGGMAATDGAAATTVGPDGSATDCFFPRCPSPPPLTIGMASPTTTPTTTTTSGTARPTHTRRS